MNESFKSPAKHHTLKNVDTLLGLDEVGESLEDIPLIQLLPFENHPFLVLDDEKMEETRESIAKFGVLVPIIVRPKGRRHYEIVSGHRRVHACQLLGLDNIPAVIRDLDDETATIVMVDSNIQRDSLRYSEKAFAYRMKLEALKQQGQRNDLTSRPVGEKWDSSAQLAQESGDSSRQIQRFIRLTYLISGFLHQVDLKQLPFQTGVELSYLTEIEQEIVFVVMAGTHVRPSLDQAVLLRGHSKAGTLTEDVVRDLLVKKPVVKGLTIKKDVSRYFPKGTNAKDMEDKIIELLEQWSGNQL